jgi:lipopolysaccharide export system protein LptC
MLSAPPIDLAFGAAERDRMFRRAARHSRLVSLMRFLIPAGSLGLVGLLLGALLVARTSEESVAQASVPKGLSDGTLTMQSPKLTGFQKDARTYEVTADTARQQVRNQTRVDLDSPVARIETAVQSFANIVAQTGVYNTKLESLDLRDKIRIITDTGYTVFLERALIDLKKGNLDSRKPVVVEMDTGRIEAQTMKARNNGDTILFAGGVSSTFKDLFGSPGSLTGRSVVAPKGAGTGH